MVEDVSIVGTCARTSLSKHQTRVIITPVPVSSPPTLPSSYCTPPAATMKGIQISQYVSGPQDMKVTTLSDPVPNPDQYTIAIHATACNCEPQLPPLPNLTPNKPPQSTTSYKSAANTNTNPPSPGSLAPSSPAPSSPRPPLHRPKLAAAGSTRKATKSSAPLRAATPKQYAR